MAWLQGGFHVALPQPSGFKVTVSATNALGVESHTHHSLIYGLAGTPYKREPSLAVG